MKPKDPKEFNDGIPIPGKSNVKVELIGSLKQGMPRSIVVNRATHSTRERWASFFLALLITHGRFLGGLPTAISLRGSPLAVSFPTAKDFADVIEDLKAQNPREMQGIFDGKKGEKIVSAEVIHGLANELKTLFKKLNAPPKLLQQGPSKIGYRLGTRPSKLKTNLLDGLQYTPRRQR